MAAFSGSASSGAIQRALAGSAAEEPTAEAAFTKASRPNSVFLGGVSVAGFRGIGKQAMLDLTPGPGLTVVSGRNGSGKSSFAEAVEVLLTGDSFRWSNRPRASQGEWKRGWKNLHCVEERSIELQLYVEGVDTPYSAFRKWARDDELESGATKINTGNPPILSIDDMGWESALAAYRPFLSYNELSSLYDEGPSKLYASLSAILGLEDLVAANDNLRVERLRIQEAPKAAKKRLDAMRPALAALEDERAAELLVALKGATHKTLKLDEVERIVSGASSPPESESRLARAQQLIDLVAPDPEMIRQSLADLETAEAAVGALVGTDAERARRTAALLRQALDFHRHHAEPDCPVCGTASALCSTWVSQTEAQVTELDEAAARATEAHDQRARALSVLDAALLKAPSWLQATDVAMPVDVTAVVDAWRLFSERGEDTDVRAHVAARLDPLVRSIEKVRASAQAWFEEHQSRWQPLAIEVADWLPGAREAQAADAAVKELQAAEKWLKAEEESIRTERFAPIRDKVQHFWELLRCASNVSLDEVALSGTATSTKRTVNLAVSVDGSEGAALGVMSQGELHALALSLFLPRATLDDSPFRFVLIDDPVQAMDPSRVDGLARALAEVAEDRQVIVFTHDDRLPDAIRRLDISATLFDVTRRSNSEVRVELSAAPYERYLDDANHLRYQLSIGKVPEGVARNVIPALCREAVEAAAIQALRKRWLLDRIHEEIEDDLNETDELADLLILLIDGHQKKPDRRVSKVDAYESFKRKLPTGSDQLIGDLNRATHDGYRGDIEDLTKSTRVLARHLAAMG